MRKTSIVLNWIVLLILAAAFYQALSKTSEITYLLGMAIGLSLFGFPFFISLRSIQKQNFESAKSAITPNYVAIGFVVLLACYGIFSSRTFAYVPIALIVTIPALLNVRLLKAQVSSSALD